MSFLSMLADGSSTLSSSGTTALWIGFVCMALSALIFVYYSYSASSKNSKMYNYITAAVVIIASLAYLVMALGGSQIVAGSSQREFLWVRYADWLLTTPLLLLDLGLLVGATHADIGWVVFCDIIMVVAGFAGVVSTGKDAAWPLFIFGMLAFVPVLYALLATFKEAASYRGPKTAALYSKLAIIMAVTWSAYPIIWAIGEGSQAVSVDVETILYAIFDVTAKCIFGFVLVMGHASIHDEEEAVRLNPTDSRP